MIAHALPAVRYGVACLLIISWRPVVAGEDGGREPMAALIERLLPGKAGCFQVENLSAPPGQNLFEIEAGENGKIILKGDTVLSQAVALNWYLKYDACVAVSWSADDAITVPETLPLPRSKIRKTTRIGQRFFLNYCTFGYSLPFWRWRDWERFIDWMALNGINLPLAQTGAEYVWQRVWRQYGLSDEEIREFFTGPAHLPWHRMSNIDGEDGPLPQSYIDGQHELQIRILARERELGMSPVLNAFAGHVPGKLQEKVPRARIERLSRSWYGYAPSFFLNPLDPFFHEVADCFMREQEKAYGPGHYYCADPFNEITPPSWEPGYLGRVAQAIYAGMAGRDPDAVWLQMSWTFNIDAMWTDERLSAMIKAVPEGRMEIIDYTPDSFRRHQAYFGAPFLWCYLGNFGGHTNMSGAFRQIEEGLGKVMKDAALGNLVGVGGTLEGLNNPVVYEFLFEQVWHEHAESLEEWVTAMARARAGGRDSNFEAAWGILTQKVFDHGYQNSVVYQATQPRLAPADEAEKSTRTRSDFQYDNADLIRAWRLLLMADASTRGTSSYRRDLVDVTRQALGNLGKNLHARMVAAYQLRDAAAFRKASDDFLALGRDIDAVLGTNSEFLLGKWIADARSWGVDKSERDFYERNARTLITIWGSSGRLVDYANRQWNGLMADYYLPRWKILIDAAYDELNSGTARDEETLRARYRAHDESFASSVDGGYPAEARDDTYVLSRRLFEKYVNQEGCREAGPNSAE